MSADRWSICPGCLHNATVAAAKAVDDVRNLYGKVPVEEFDTLRAALKPVQAEDYRTFREDYEVGIREGGIVVVDYFGKCTTCDLKAQLQVTEEFWKPGVS